MASKSSSSICNDQIALHIKPQKQMNKVLLFRKQKNGKQALRQGFGAHNPSSSLSLDSQQPSRSLSYLKRLKSIKHLTLGITYPFIISQHFILKILRSLKSLKGLSVIHIELTCLSLLHRALDFNSFCQAFLLINDLPRVQIEFSFHFSEGAVGMMVLEQTALFGNLSKLERLTSVSLTFSNFIDVRNTLFAIHPLKKSNSLTKFSLTLQDSPVGSPPQVHDLLIFLKEIKSLKSSEIFFKRYSLPSYKKLKELIPLLEEAGQRGPIKIIFDKCTYKWKDFEGLKFIKSVKKIKSPHKVEVNILPLKSLYCLRIEWGIYIFFLIFWPVFIIAFVVKEVILR